MRLLPSQSSSARLNRCSPAGSTWASAAPLVVIRLRRRLSAVPFKVRTTISQRVWTSCADILVNHILRSKCMPILEKAPTCPIWLLGSSDFSARLAARLGLPFAFAAHFQPGPLLPALHIYRSSFRPSHVLDRPYVMVGIPILVADSDEHAQFLATTPIQMFLNLIRGVPGPLPPPTKNLQWTAQEREMVAAKFGAAIFGGAERVAARLHEFLEETHADELIVVTNTYDFADRLRSYELLADLAGQRQEEPEVVARG